MRNIQEIINDLRSTLEWSQPNVRYNDFLSLINELELISSQKQTPVKETTTVVKEHVTEEPKPKTSSKKSTKTEE
tara:strand:+ start:766 stop:990 length:225 start_codon:yes stop_codon:yes gene_type:complete